MITFIFITHCILMYLYISVSNFLINTIEVKVKNLFYSIFLKYVINAFLIIFYFVTPIVGMFSSTCFLFITFIIFMIKNGNNIINHKFSKHYYNDYFILTFFLVIFMYFIFNTFTHFDLLCLWFYTWTLTMNNVNKIYSVMIILCMFIIHCIRFIIRFLKNEDKDFLSFINDFSIF